MPTLVTKPTCTEIGREYIKKRIANTLFSRGYWHKYQDGVWQPVSDNEINVDIWNLLEGYEKTNNIKPTLSIYNTVYKYVRDHLSVNENRLDTYPNLINLRNGIFNLDTQTLMAHNPTLLLTSQLPFEYDAKADCPWWNHYLKTTFIDAHTGQVDESLIRLVQEAIAYSMTTDISYQLMFWCVGEGENGKGVLFHVLTQLGGNTVTPLDLNNLRRERYQLATLADKRIALCSESSSTQNLLEDATVKALVAGDTMQVRQIRREPFTLKPQVKLWWSMNRLPAIADTSHGMWRRIVMLAFNKTFDEKSRIRNLKERLDKELPGIFNDILSGLIRLRAESKFSYCQQADVMKAEYQYDSNKIRLFVDDCCNIDASKRAPAGELYRLYSEWAKKNGYRPLSNISFKQEMESLKYYWKMSAGRWYLGLEISSKKATDAGLGPWQQTTF